MGILVCAIFECGIRIAINFCFLLKSFESDGNQMESVAEEASCVPMYPDAVSDRGAVRTKLCRP